MTTYLPSLLYVICFKSQTLLVIACFNEEEERESRCLIEGMKGKGKIVMVGKIGKKGKIGCH